MSQLIQDKFLEDLVFIMLYRSMNLILNYNVLQLKVVNHLIKSDNINYLKRIKTLSIEE